MTMKIYTGFGDKGETALYGGGVVKKSHIRVEAYGTLDELNSLIGLLRSENSDVDIGHILELIQRDVFVFSAEIASQKETESEQISKEQITRLETQIDWLSESLPPLKQFILPGGCKPAAVAHLIRTVCRRAERALVALNEKLTIRDELLIYINRLSDFFFVLARYLNHINNTKDIPWAGLKKKE